MAEARLHVIVTGRVQGVGFRYFVLNAAQVLGLHGMVRNLRHDQVEVVAEGVRRDLERLERAVRQGPPAARVTSVQTSWGDPVGGFSGFSLRPSA